MSVFIKNAELVNSKRIFERVGGWQGGRIRNGRLLLNLGQLHIMYTYFFLFLFVNLLYLYDDNK